MIIKTVVTADSFDGQPWPPNSTDRWHLVRRSHGFSIWRSISAQSDPPPADCDHLGGSNCHSK
jgi:hypothetical protein